jgi:hypothetical protein
MWFPAYHWLRSWTNRRRAYFRPTDTCALDAALLPLVDHIVTVRFWTLNGRRDYRILGHGTSPQFVRPERDFDFLE